MLKIRIILIIAGLTAWATACTTTRVIEKKNLEKTAVDPGKIISKIPDHDLSLTTIKGKGKAIVSEPGNSERFTVYFSGNRDKSLVIIKNGLGIEGSQLLAEGDSLLIYNKIDKIARKVSVTKNKLSSINHLASVNILEMMNFTVQKEEVKTVLESESNYVLELLNGGQVFIDKKNFTILQVDQPRHLGLPYSRIIYGAYEEIEGYVLPRRVTIFSADARSKVALLIQSLDVNPGNLELTVDIPKDVNIVRQ